MRGFLCAELLGFLESRFGITPGGVDRPRCARDTCPDVRHVREWAKIAAPEIGLPPGELLRLFGVALFPRLVRAFPAFLVGVESTADLAARFDTHVAAELRKLDPRVELPRLRVRFGATEAAELRYESDAGLAELAWGLLRGSAIHFEEEIEVVRCDAPGDPGGVATFLLCQPARRFRPRKRFTAGEEGARDPAPQDAAPVLSRR
jgi:heme-NO-binding protein